MFKPFTIVKDQASRKYYKVPDLPDGQVFRWRYNDNYYMKMGQHVFTFPCFDMCRIEQFGGTPVMEAARPVEATLTIGKDLD